MITRDDIEAMTGYEYYTPRPIKAPVTVEQMVDEFSRVTQQKGTPELYSKLISEELMEVVDAIESLSKNPSQDNLLELLKEYGDLVYVIAGLFRSLGVSFDEVMWRIHSNNVGRCVQPDGTVHRREDGKIIKNKDYPKVDLKGVLPIDPVQN